MAKQAVRDMQNGTLPAAEQPKQVQLTPENAAIFQAKFTEMLVVELRKLNINFERMLGKMDG